MWLFLDLIVEQLKYRTTQSWLLSRGGAEAEGVGGPYPQLIKLIVEGTAPRLPLFLTPPANSRVSETTPSINSSWEGYTELTESCYTHSYFIVY